MCRFIPPIVLVALLILAGHGCERSRSRSAGGSPNVVAPVLSDADMQFIRAAQEINVQERNVGRIGLQNSRNDAVRNYAETLVDEHTRLLDDLVRLKLRKAMSQSLDSPEKKDQALVDLNAQLGPAFERNYVTFLAVIHERALEKFRQAQELATDESVREYAKRVLPVFERHLRTDRELQIKLSMTQGPK